MLPLFLLFTVVPLIELWLLFQLSGLFGFWTTIAVVLGTGITGAALARWQGFQALNRMQGEIRQGIVPAHALGDGVLILVAGLLLVTPGVLTDCLGLSLLIPPVRSLAMKAVLHWVQANVRVDSVRFNEPAGSNTPRRGGTIVDAQVIDAHVVDANGEHNQDPKTTGIGKPAP